MRKKNERDPCIGCGWYDYDLGCTCPSHEKWYQCRLEPEPTPEDFLTEEELRREGKL